MVSYQTSPSKPSVAMLSDGDGGEMKKMQVLKNQQQDQQPSS